MNPTCQKRTVQAGGGSVMVWSVCSCHYMGFLIRLDMILTGDRSKTPYGEVSVAQSFIDCTASTVIQLGVCPIASVLATTMYSWYTLDDFDLENPSCLTISEIKQNGPCVMHLRFVLDRRHLNQAVYLYWQF
ncbi:hypothetical protein TNCV_4209111 [Trichonephila clavipes]|nr:hypothetical protein TNCV_4209111 [Trichonephila clavipes]